MINFRYYKEIAEIYETDNNLEMAVSTYEQAAEFFNNDNKKSNATQCLQKVATISSESGNFLKAADIFQQIAQENMQSNLGKFSAKGYLFQSLLCVMATGDWVATHQRIDQSREIDYSFSSSRECDLISKLVKACEDNNSEEFSQSCADFDRISPLDPWKTSILLKAKKHITDMSGEEVDLS